MNNFWNNSGQLKRIQYRFIPYIKIMWNAFTKGVSVSRIIKSRKPYLFADPKIPASLSIEFTDACDLKCVYCSNPLFANPRIFMKTDVFNETVKSLKTFPIDRVRVGGGEPTLHPQFSRYSTELKGVTKYLSIVTNGQWKKPGIIESLVCNYDLIEISIDAGGVENYEKSRKGGDFKLLVENLEKLKTYKMKLNSKVFINIRLMIRPSNDITKNKEYTFWKKYCNSVMPQYIIQDSESEYEEDVYKSVHILEQAYPKCTLPFKDIQIRANGNVPLCQISGSATRIEKRKIIGNVKVSSLQELWTGEALTTIRKAHKNRDEKSMSICQGCGGC